MLTRLRGWWPAGPREPEAGVEAAPAETAGLRYRLADPLEDAKPRTLISLFGEAPENAGELLEAVAAACRGEGAYPVAVMSDLRPALIVQASMPIEFMPPWQGLRVEPEDYARHVRRRWSLVLAKWDVRTRIDLGDEFEAFLRGEMETAGG